MTNLERAIKDGYAHIIGEKGKQKITYVSSDNHVENYSDPEEKVRAEFWAELIYKYEYPVNRIKIEVTVPDRLPTDRADIVVFRDDECKRPYAVVECKKDGVTDAEFNQAIEQGVGNATWVKLRADYVVIIAGGTRRVLDVTDKFGALEREQNILADLPHAYGKPQEFSLSSQLLEMGPDLMEFVRGHIFKIMESDDAKRCQFNGSVSPVLSLLESMEESDDESFIEATRVLGENLFDIMCDSVTIPAADLLCVTFQVQSVIHIALLKMNYKVTYVHREEEDAEANDIVKQRVMPTDSAKLTEAVIIDLTEYKVRLVEKKYEMLNGDKINYLSERFLQCYADLAPKKKFQILNKVINDINNHYPEDGIAKRLDMKSRLREEFTENQAFKVNEIGDKLFGNHQGKKQEFDEKIERYDMQYDTFTVAKENTVKKLEYQMLETDTGIEIKIPMEEYNTKDNVEIIEEPGGGSTIIIKNIENVKIK